jgi:hypothetical protein
VTKNDVNSNVFIPKRRIYEYRGGRYIIMCLLYNGFTKTLFEHYDKHFNDPQTPMYDIPNRVSANIFRLNSVFIYQSLKETLNNGKQND